jgi:uncharacterized membrane protein YqgA involved in biofilm formation
MLTSLPRKGPGPSGKQPRFGLWVGYAPTWKLYKGHTILDRKRRVDFKTAVVFSVMLGYSMLASFGLLVVVLLIRYVVRFVHRYLSGEPQSGYTTTNDIRDGSMVSKFTGLGRGVLYLFHGPELLRRRYAEVSRITNSIFVS